MTGIVRVSTIFRVFFSQLSEGDKNSDKEGEEIVKILCFSDVFSNGLLALLNRTFTDFGSADWLG